MTALLRSPRRHEIVSHACVPADLDRGTVSPWRIHEGPTHEAAGVPTRDDGAAAFAGTLLDMCHLQPRWRPEGDRGHDLPGLFDLGRARDCVEYELPKSPSREVPSPGAEGASLPPPPGLTRAVHSGRPSSDLQRGATDSGPSGPLPFVRHRPVAAHADFLRVTRSVV